MDIRAIVCDVDGTLLTSKQVVDERTVSSIKKAVANYVTEDKDSNGIGVFIEKFI